MPSTARITDLFIGVCGWHPPLPPITMGGTIVTGSGNVKINELGAARLTDVVLGYCGHVGVIVGASGDTKTNELGVARLGDPVVGCLIGMIATGSGNVNTN